MKNWHSGLQSIVNLGWFVACVPLQKNLAFCFSLTGDDKKKENCEKVPKRSRALRQKTLALKFWSRNVIPLGNKIVNIMVHELIALHLRNGDLKKEHRHRAIIDLFQKKRGLMCVACLGHIVWNERCRDCTTPMFHTRLPSGCQSSAVQIMRQHFARDKFGWSVPAATTKISSVGSTCQVWESTELVN